MQVAGSSATFTATMPDHTYHFISGLPRSGSTLLSAILRQNPRFHAGISSPVASLAAGLLGQVSAGSEFAALVDARQRRALLRGLFDAYYADHPQQVVVDTNRLWCGRLPLLRDLFPAAKVIACVRNVAWVMDSIERLYRANPYENTRLFNQAGGRGSVYTRLEGLIQHDQMVGSAWAALREAYYGEQADSLLVVDYDLLSRAPQQVIPLIYDFLGEPGFDHDFEHIEYDAVDFDLQLGVPGLHRVRSKVAFQARRTILPPDLFDKYSKLSFWGDRNGSRANVISNQPALPGDPL
ncbi:sulfotransferase [Duganella sp. 1411]|uniref:sulfotransferase family protein n=1 Tax=Duganella sp. 1411 TaxID=2806572 RepID=UPI001B5A8716|nr:sulfotransferase [Duganella sp. 1411]MBP1207873.1 sulfotransferase [Duganella sp. 1411]